MNQRLLVLDQVKPTSKLGRNVVRGSKSTYEIEVTHTGSHFLAPPGYYLLLVVHQEIPSQRGSDCVIVCFSGVLMLKNVPARI
jgi:hypothetical protein